MKALLHIFLTSRYKECINLKEKQNKLTLAGIILSSSNLKRYEKPSIYEEGSFNMRPARCKFSRGFDRLLDRLPKLFDRLTNTLCSWQNPQKQCFFHDRACCDVILTALPIVFAHFIVSHTKQNNRVGKYCISNASAL